MSGAVSPDVSAGQSAVRGTLTLIASTITTQVERSAATRFVNPSDSDLCDAAVLKIGEDAQEIRCRDVMLPASCGVCSGIALPCRFRQSVSFRGRSCRVAPLFGLGDRSVYDMPAWYAHGCRRTGFPAHLDLWLANSARRDQYCRSSGQDRVEPSGQHPRGLGATRREYPARPVEGTGCSGRCGYRNQAGSRRQAGRGGVAVRRNPEGDQQHPKDAAGHLRPQRGRPEAPTA